MKHSLGQSMIEVLIAILIVTMVLTAVVAAILVGIRSTQFSKHKAQATFLAQESMEWLRAEKLSMSWVEFVDLASISGADYCLKNLDLLDLTACSFEADLIDDMYVRDLTLTSNVGLDEVEAEVEFGWYEGEKLMTSPIITTFYDRNLDD